MPSRGSLPPRPSHSYFQKFLGAPGSPVDETEDNSPSPTSACALDGHPAPGGLLPSTGNRKVHSAHAQPHHVPTDVAAIGGGSEQVEDFPDHLGDPLTDVPEDGAFGNMQQQSLLNMPPGRSSLPPRPSTVPNAAPASDGDLVFAPGMSVSSPSHRAVTFAQLRARDSQLGFGSVASSGVLQILDKRPRAASAAASGSRADEAATAERTRSSARPSAARPRASGQGGGVVQAPHSTSSAPQAALPARPRTVGSGFRTTSAVRGSTAVGERGRFVSSEGSQAQRCAVGGSANICGDGGAGMSPPLARGNRSPDRRGASAGAQVAAGASVGIDVRHVQRQVRSALQHGGDLVVEVGSVMDGSSLQDASKPEKTHASAKGFKGRPDPAQTGLMKELLGSHNPSLAREGEGRGVQKR